MPASATDVVSVWAPGGGGLAFPDFLGANLFGDDSYQGFTIQIHYDNPSKLLAADVPSFDPGRLARRSHHGCYMKEWWMT